MRFAAGVSLLLLPLTAAAQPGMTPYYAQPPPGSNDPVVAAPAEPKVRLEVSLVAASPKGDWEDMMTGAETSPGFGLQLGFTLAPNISLFGGVRFIRVKFNEEQQAFPQNSELSHRELQVGLRYTTNVAPAAKVFVEGNIHSARLEMSVEGDSQSIHGMGMGGRVGLIFMADSKIGIGVAGSYSSSNITAAGSDTEIDDAWLSGDLFFNAWF